VLGRVLGMDLGFRDEGLIVHLSVGSEGLAQGFLNSLWLANLWRVRGCCSGILLVEGKRGLGVTSAFST
jgi:hypothetical protein